MITLSCLFVLKILFFTNTNMLCSVLADYNILLIKTFFTRCREKNMNLFVVFMELTKNKFFVLQ